MYDLDVDFNLWYTSFFLEDTFQSLAVREVHRRACYLGWSACEEYYKKRLRTILDSQISPNGDHIYPESQFRDEGKEILIDELKEEFKL